MTTSCAACPLRRLPIFAEFSKDDLAFMERFKTAEMQAQPGTEIMAEGASSAQLYTVLSGMGLRYKTLEDGRRQVIGFALPGDFVGLQTGVMEVMQHSVEATSAMVLCVFNRSDLWSLFKAQPQRAFDLAHLAAREERMLGEAMTAVGQMNGRRKVAWALHRFFTRLSDLNMADQGVVPLPFRQQDLADALGLSLVHTNKSLAKLREEGIATWQDHELAVHELETLTEIGQISSSELPKRPLI